MGLMTAYLVTTKNAEAFFNALQTARAPERFTTKFLKDLDFASSNDRLFAGVLKGLGFLDENGTPTSRYYSFLDHSQSRRVLADAVREAYDDLFALNRNAKNMDIDEVRGKFRSLTQGQKSENVINLMANTFDVLRGLADWSETAGAPAPGVASAGPAAADSPGTAEASISPIVGALGGRAAPTGPVSREIDLHYNIQIILPESRDEAVYDALFASLRKHLF